LKSEATTFSKKDISATIRAGLCDSATQSKRMTFSIHTGAWAIAASNLAPSSEPLEPDNQTHWFAGCNRHDLEQEDAHFEGQVDDLPIDGDELEGTPDVEVL
jgi:hypothetical protein